MSGVWVSSGTGKSGGEKPAGGGGANPSGGGGGALNPGGGGEGVLLFSLFSSTSSPS